MLKIRVDEIDVTPGRVYRPARFLRGPIPWTPLSAAARLPGQALAVFLAIHHRVALTGDATVTLPKALLSQLGISRDAKSRALCALEGAGLVAVERAEGRTARIKLTDHDKGGSHDK
jgi:hypothetical protein